MAEPVIFKSQTFGGFNKEEVLKYIDSVNAQHSEEQEKANAEIIEKDKALAEKSEKLDDLQAKYDEIMAAYEELRQHYLMLKEHSDNIDAENEKLFARCEKAEKELAIEKELNRQLEDKIDAEKQKAEQRAAQEKRIAASIESANDSAKLMLTAARDNAKNIIAEAQSGAEEINSDIDEFRLEIEKTKSFMEDSLAVLVQRLEYIAKSAEEAKLPSGARINKAEEIDKKYEELVAENENRTAVLRKRFFQ
ncbi:MAG: hypothetical protein IJD62_03740 [Oscillospiraceae bacterium]|nr:hypothetical protein [Oscillospiraceae bacterium]